MYKLEGVRSYPSGPAVYLSSKVPNTLSKLENVYQIAGLHAIALNEDRRTMRIYGYNGEFSLATWHKSFGAKADSPCRLDSIFFSEQGPVLLAALHPSLPLFLNVSEHEKGQIVLISYEKEKEFTHAGHFIPREGASRQRIREVFWLGHLPLFCILTQELTLKLVGPAIQPVAEDIDSYAAMLAYSMNTCTPYLWKSYFSRDLSSLHISPEKILHVATLSDPDRDRFTEVMILLEGNAAVLIFLRIGNVLSQDDLEVQLKVKGRTELKLCGEIREKHVLRLPTNRHEAFRVAFTTEKSMQIYTMCALPKKGGLKCDMAGEILLPAESDKIRVNSFQIPLIAIMDKANVVPLNS
ncbi:MAG: hypothetical protein P4M11_03005 [Candidatus Pacebacteria bacterium]|nr:hypothetical protein [Candidatus Paceibacterota bacterium]